MKLGTLMIAIGTVTAFCGRHTVVGLISGVALLFAGWIFIEIKEASHDEIYSGS